MYRWDRVEIDSRPTSDKFVKFRRIKSNFIIVDYLKTRWLITFFFNAFKQETIDIYSNETTAF